MVIHIQNAFPGLSTVLRFENSALFIRAVRVAEDSDVNVVLIIGINGNRGDLLCIVPATANVIAKAATGLADDLLSTLILSFSGPIVLAPAMNTDMWNKPVVARNVETLKRDGMPIVGPEPGWLSCRKTGPGRMADPETIQATIAALLGDDQMTV